MSRNLLSLMVCVTLARAQTPDLDTLAKIRAEATDRSQVAPVFEMCTVTIGRLCLPPTHGQLAEIPRLRTEMTDVDARIRQLIDEDLPSLNKLMSDAGVPHISISDQNAAAGERGRR
jgi:hypothetical protein